MTDIPEILPIVHTCLQRNQIHDALVQPLLWGQFGSDTSIDHLIQKVVESQWHTKIDYIIGSDTFYEPARKFVKEKITLFLNIFYMYV